ncbi:phosphopantetheine-binding protein [Paenibacillus apiarius]|uniref:phosphopantetheine-binding protein n=1 Tax=Paenibacillus apiarius TaxID=46240 RepID=UPI00197ECC19|nr:phosphopantetheine-binding protein [Paenibacillus apiarius]MBN3526384.1 acyl carrier protein [Paenibacillus apiarius]
MTKDKIFGIIKGSIIEFLPEVSADEISMEQSLRDLGANSIDRMEIIVKSMEDLKIKIPMVQFGNLKDIQALVDLLYEKKLELG